MKNVFKTLLAAAAATTLIAGSAFAEGYSQNTGDTTGSQSYNNQTQMNTEMDSGSAGMNMDENGVSSNRMNNETDTTRTSRTDSDMDANRERAAMSTPSAETVRQVQRSLNREGYSLSVDGILGPETQAAIRSFQSDNDLDVSGRLNNETLSELDVASDQTDRSDRY